MFKTNLLSEGNVYEIAGRRYLSRGRGPGGRIRLDDVKRKMPIYLSSERLNDYVLEGKARLLPPSALDDSQAAPQHPRHLPGDLASLPELEQEATRRRADYVRAVQHAGPTGLTRSSLDPIIEACREVRGDARGPSWRSVVRWVRAVERGGSVLSLVAEKRGNSHSRICSVTEQMMDRAVEAEYLNLARRTLKHTHRILCANIDQENRLLPLDQHILKPSYRALQRFVRKLDRFLIMSRRYGERYARRWFRAYRMGAIALSLLDLVQVDHTTLDLQVTYLRVLKLGKPTITIVLDTYSRMVMGFHISFEPPSYLSVMEALRMSILPKDQLIADLKQRGIVNNDWPIHGVPSRLLLDNGKEFTGNDLRNAAAHLGMDLTFTPPRSPWFKGAVERFLLGLKNDLISRIPGRTFPVREDQPEGETDDLMIDLQDLQDLLTKWIVDIFHETPHGTNGLTPRAMFNYSQRGEEWF